MNFTRWSFLTISAIILLTLGACGNSTAVNKNTSPVEKEAVRSKPEKQAELPVDNPKIQDDLEKAKNEGKAVFIVVTGNGVTDTDKATAIAKGANAIYKKATVVQMNRDDAANSKLVAEWRLAGAPLPIVLVISPKGQLSGGRLLSQATAENIAALIPSPKLEEVYSSIAASKPALVVFTKKSLSDRTQVLQECKNAVAILKNNAVIIEVNMDDTNETNFINQLRIDKSSKVSTTLVINTQGQVAGTSASVPDAAKLANAATAPVKSGCGPGCGPAGCAK